MLAASLKWLRPRTLRRRGPTRLQKLKRQLGALRATNDTAQATLTERRRLAALSMRFGPTRHGSSDASKGQHTRREGATPTAADAAAAHDALRRDALRLLPQNPSLEASIAFVLHENRDARAELEFTRQLLNSTLLSLASPVAPVWDPYDVKPQVFALDTYLALPVFTSLEYLELFCRRFQFTVRDPSGTLWTDGAAAAAAQSSSADAAPLLPDVSALTQSDWWRAATTRANQTDGSDSGGVKNLGSAPRATTPQAATPAAEPSTQYATTAEADYMSAESLFDDVMDHIHADSQKKAEKRQTGKCHRRRRRRARSSPSSRGASSSAFSARGRHRLRRRARRRLKSSARAAPHPSHNEAAEDTDAQARREAFMAEVAAVSPFGIRQATPLPAFGPLIHPFFVGYFADINTLLHNAAIVPDKVDLVVNPGSPLEFVMAREATNRILHKDQLLLHAYQRVERELQHEFSRFFARYCPGVRTARSACVPRPVDYDTAMQALREAHGVRGGTPNDESEKDNPLRAYRERTRVLRESAYSSGVVYELVILIDCDTAEDLAETFHRLREGKRRCLIMGHSDLDVLPEAGAAPPVRAAAKHFYERAAHAGGAVGDDAASGEMGLYRVAGERQTINVSQPADSYFHDPTNTYTEPHAVFTEELKLTRSH